MSENLYVRVSKKITQQKESVGYFYNHLTENYWEYGRHFFSVSEMDCVKEYDFELILLKELIQLDNFLTPVIYEFAYNGYKRKPVNTFIEVSDQERKGKEDVYPCAFI
ncbi:MAG TPA: hypothetical protein VNW99_11005 [Cytophagaceae bacterium]|jgi:hypothetical protein|nr:hypothetical protein [Cytophagaceae bacterium]